jgi:hypothetical protein
MNTFVIKITYEINGKFIGLSEKDGQRIYIFRSHQVFKQLNPKVKETDFEVLEGNDPKNNKSIEKLDDEFNFKKNNICPRCGGLGAFYFVSCDKPMNGSVLFDEDGYAMFDEKVCCYCTCNDVIKIDGEKYTDGELAGTYIGYLESKLHVEKRDSKDRIDELYLQLLTLQAYVKLKSTCKKCGGNQHKMYAHERCEECGLPGDRIFIMGG